MYMYTKPRLRGTICGRVYLSISYVLKLSDAHVDKRLWCSLSTRPMGFQVGTTVPTVRLVCGPVVRARVPSQKHYGFNAVSKLQRHAQTTHCEIAKLNSHGFVFLFVLRPCKCLSYRCWRVYSALEICPGGLDRRLMREGGDRRAPVATVKDRERISSCVPPLGVLWIASVDPLLIRPLTSPKYVSSKLDVSTQNITFRHTSVR